MRASSLVRTLVFGMALAINGGPVVAQGQPVTLRFSYWVPPGSMPGPVMEAWAKAVTDASRGTLVVQTFPASQLGKAADHYDMARDGIADITWAVPGFQAGRFTMFGAMELPFMASNSPDGVLAMDEWYRQYAPREMSEVKYCMAVAAPVSTLNFVARQVDAPGDLKGLRVRPTNAIIGRYLSAAGASVVSVPASEAAQAFERGLLDGMVLSWRTLIPFGLDKFVKVHMDFPFAVNPSAFVMNKQKYDSLNAAQKAVIDQHCSPEWSQRIARMWNDWEDEGRATLEKQGGHRFYKISATHSAAWRAAGDALTQEWVRDASGKGYDGTRALEDLRRRIKARNAAF